LDLNDASVWRLELARRYIDPYEERAAIAYDGMGRENLLLDLPREQVRTELDDLVGATLDLVEEHLPDVDTSRARRLWSLPAEPSEGGGGQPPPPSQPG
jgi:hypothetical protein